MSLLAAQAGTRSRRRRDPLARLRLEIDQRDEVTISLVPEQSPTPNRRNELDRLYAQLTKTQQELIIMSAALDALTAAISALETEVSTVISEADDSSELEALTTRVEAVQTSLTNKFNPAPAAGA